MNEKDHEQPVAEVRPNHPLNRRKKDNPGASTVALWIVMRAETVDDHHPHAARCTKAEAEKLANLLSEKQGKLFYVPDHPIFLRLKAKRPPQR